MKYIILSLLAIVSAAAAPIELGKVNWERKIEPAFNKSQNDGKPIFLLFQEIPG